MMKLGCIGNPRCGKVKGYQMILLISNGRKLTYRRLQQPSDNRSYNKPSKFNYKPVYDTVSARVLSKAPSPVINMM